MATGSRPSSTILAMVGDMIPPWGVPFWVGYACCCTQPFDREMGTPVPRSETSASQSAYSSVKYECIRPETERIGKCNSGVVHLNRRIRNRTYGGVGGRRRRLLLLPNSTVLKGEELFIFWNNVMSVYHPFSLDSSSFSSLYLSYYPTFSFPIQTEFYLYNF